MTVVPADCPFTVTELQIIDHIADGKGLKEIALLLGRSASTARTHLHNAYKKINVRNRSHLVNECYKRGWLGRARDLSDREATLVEREEACEEWPEVTPAQKAYLAAFDRWLRAPAGTIAEARASAAKSYMLGAMYVEKGMEIPSAR